MKRIYNILLTAAAMIAFLPTLSAQGGINTSTGNPNSYQLNAKGIGYSKDITGPDDDGVYTIHLHTFVAGNGEVIHSDLPADVVLVLDVSGSMDEDMETVISYTALNSTTYSYNSIGSNSNYWYLYEGQYYQVNRRVNDTGGLFNHHYYFYLYFTDDAGVVHYLSGTSDQTTAPSNAPNEESWYTILNPSNSTTIFTGVLYSKTETTQTKMQALKNAVNAFIDLIEENDTDRQGNPLGNTISIVKFAMDSYYTGETATSTTPTGNHTYRVNTTEGLRYYNYTEIVAGFTEVADGGAQTLKGLVSQLQAGGATAADYGMSKAKALINSLYDPDTGEPNRQSNKTVVFFTDGSPTYSDGFEDAVANATILAAKDIKSKVAYTDNGTNINVSVYSVGVFDGQNSTRDTYMQHTSSNFPNASSLTDAGSGGNLNGNYYQDASQGNLEDVFRNIASEAGGNTSLNSSTITAIDVVSQSFTIPDNAGDIKVYEVPVVAAYTNTEGRDTVIFQSRYEQPGWTVNPTGVTITPDPNNPNKITASGFNYAANYCGVLSVDGVASPHGSKLVLEIPITMADDAVGGPGVETNGPESGIYLDGKNELYFESPTIDLPVNLQVKKEGLEIGESSKYMIQRIPKTDDPATSTDWEDVTTIFVTKTGEGDPDVYIRGLNPNYHYRILEEGWDWSYKFNYAYGEGYVVDSSTDKTSVETIYVNNKEQVTSDKFVSNPITFSNSKKTNIESKVHHAESKARNVFDGSKPEYTDSKQRVTPPTPPTPPESE